MPTSYSFHFSCSGCLGKQKVAPTSLIPTGGCEDPWDTFISLNETQDSFKLAGVFHWRQGSRGPEDPMFLELEPTG